MYLQIDKAWTLTVNKMRFSNISSWQFRLFIKNKKKSEWASNKNDEKKREYLNKIYKLKYEISVLFLAGDAHF